MPLSGFAPRNRLLSAISSHDLGLLAPHLTLVPFGLRHAFEEPDKPIENVYFIEHGLISVVATRDDDREIEIGLIGREGMTGAAVLLGDDRTPYSVYGQSVGEALRIGVREFRKALRASETLRPALLKFVQALLIQTGQTALSNARGTVEQRLARWLLMANDRLDRTEMALTHEFLSIMLGVRRAGVTVALQELEARGLVQSGRGRIAVKDRAGLERLAGPCYGPAEAAYRRLFA